MPVSRRTLLAAAPAALLARPAIIRAQGFTPVRVGEISSYAALPSYGIPYRKGWELGLTQVNAMGGINGRPVEFVSRDDGGDPATAASMAADLLHAERVDLLAGGFLSQCALAVSSFAEQNKALYVAGEPLASSLTWEKGNRYTFRIRPSTFEQAAMLVETAQTFPAKTWAIVAPDDPYGRSAAHWFQMLLTRLQPGVRFVSPQFPALGDVHTKGPSPVVAALAQAAPDAIFNALYANDLIAFVREGNARGLWANRAVASMLTGEPEYLAALAGDTPPGWLVTGYPASTSDEPFNKGFALDYLSNYHEPPTMGAAVGWSMVHAIVSGVLNSGGTKPEAMAKGFENAAFNTPFGICRFRELDHQSTMGTYVGRLARAGNQGGMVDWRFVDGSAVMPPDADVRKLRPGT